jgi:hypothetical protein|uniref:Uncharacterized protein n=1 Tax=viral metagenome TaxID=1070528 RepID=A0A6C0EEM8_9ZZZZ
MNNKSYLNKDLFLNKYNIMSENDNEKKVSQEFVNAVKKYIEVDDILKDAREKIKKLNNDKKNNEEFILNYLKSIDEKVIDIQDGKLRRNISKTQSPLKKELIQKALIDIIGDSIKATSITEQIIKSRPIVERVTLKRTRNRKTEVQDTS